MDPKLLCWNTARTIKASPSNSRPVIPVQHMAAAPRWRARLFIKAWRGLPANDRQRQTLPCAWRGEGCLKELSSQKSLKVLIDSFNCSGMGANLQFRARNHGSWIDQSVTLGSGHPSSSPSPPVTFEGTLEALRSGRVSIAACQCSPGVIESGIPENVIWHSGIQFEGFADLHFSKMLIELGWFLCPQSKWKMFSNDNLRKSEQASKSITFIWEQVFLVKSDGFRTFQTAASKLWDQWISMRLISPIQLL